MPGSGEAASYGDLLITSLLVLGGVCVAAFVVVKMLGRFLSTGSRRGAHLLDVIARVPLEPRRSLYVVDVAGKTLLVGTSEMGLSVLSELDREAVHARAVERPATFAEMVRTAWIKRRAARASASEVVDDSLASKVVDDSSASKVVDDRSASKVVDDSSASKVVVDSSASKVVGSSPSKVVQSSASKVVGSTSQVGAETPREGSALAKSETASSSGDKA